MTKNSFLPTPRDLFFSKNDPEDQRLGDLSGPSTDLTLNSKIYLAGYPDDEGIRHNGGRPGAAQGPNAIRNRLYRMTPPPFSGVSSHEGVEDLGNLNTSAYTLANRHQIIAETVATALETPSNRWIGLGGGHDFGFADGDGFLRVYSKKDLRPIVINFDAHLDVRPVISKEKISSGTPFYRLLEKYPNQFDFLEVGLQPFCNSAHHYQWLKEKGGLALSMNDLRKSSLPFSQQITQTLEALGPLKGRPCYLSVDIDVFSTAHAPGCSQSWPSGMTTKEFFPCLEMLCNILKIKTLGIYEVSPPLDQDEQTAKLAAEIIYHFLYS